MEPPAQVHNNSYVQHIHMTMNKIAREQINI